MKVFNLVVAILLCTHLPAQQKYWQQQLSYNIRAELNDKERSITGFETIVYKNNSSSSLNFIWFHIWANAYKNDSTALIRQIKNDTSRTKKLLNYGKGSIEGLSFTVNGKPVQTAAHPDPRNIDIIKVLLNSPLLPGDSVTISTPFKIILPPYFSRSGFANGEFMACQWYPKPAVYDKDGWHEFPYLDMGEFYSEYADYSVTITIPSDYVVAATGTLQSREELDVYKTVGAKNVATHKKKPSLYVPLNNNEKKTLVYYASQVPDFAWFADKEFIIQYDTVQLAGGKVIDAFSYYHDTDNTQWKNSIDYIKNAVLKYSEWIGEYEYPLVQAVEGPKNNSSGGMEYPMITLITSPDAKAKTLDAVIAHEVGHNWFMGMLGSNERAHTWMDEGLNTYFQFRYEAEKYRSNSLFGEAIPKEVRKMTLDQFLDVIYRVIEKNIPMQSAMDIPANNFQSSEEYGLVSYVKTALWLFMLEKNIGWEKMQIAFHNYFNKWKFKHPQPVDLQSAFEEAIGSNLNGFFTLINKEGSLN
jgi:hypothetical protein